MLSKRMPRRSQKGELVKDSGAFAVAMDIDAAGLPFLKNLDPTGRKQIGGGSA